jgi:hypothetical protein
MSEQPTNVIPFKRRLSWREREIIDYFAEARGSATDARGDQLVAGTGAGDPR